MYKKAFTFIELVVVVAIIAIMTSVLLVSTSGSRTDKALEAAAREVAATIREAQNYALTGKGAGAGCNTYTFSYGGGAYSVSNGGGCSVNNSYALENGVTFQNPGSLSFSFSAPHGAIGGLGASPRVITLTKGKNINVCVYSSGKIAETDIGGSCP